MSTRKNKSTSDLSLNPVSLQAQSLPNSDDARANLRQVLSARRNLQVLGAFYCTQDAVVQSNTVGSLTRPKIVEASRQALRPTTVQHCVAALVSAGLLEQVDPDGGSRVPAYMLSAQGLQLSQEDVGAVAREAFRDVSKENSEGGELAGGRQSVAKQEQKYHEPPSEEIRQALTARYSEEILGLFCEKLSSLSTDGEVQDEPVTLTRLDMLDGCQRRIPPTTLDMRLGELARVGLVERREAVLGKARVLYILTELGEWVARGVIGQAAKAAIAALVKGRSEEPQAQAVTRRTGTSSIREAIQLRVQSDPELQGVFDWLLDRASVRIPILLAAIRSSERVPDKRALANHVALEWLEKTNESITHKSVHGHFKSFRERDLLDAYDRATAKAFKVRVIALELGDVFREHLGFDVIHSVSNNCGFFDVEESIGQGDKAFDTPEESAFISSADQAVAAPIGSDNRSSEVVDHPDAEESASTAVPEESTTASSSPVLELPSVSEERSEEPAIVKKIRRAASQFQQLALAVEGRKIREVDAQALSQMNPEEAVQLLRAARNVQEIEQAIVSRLPNAKVEFECVEQGIHMHLSEPLPQVADFIRYASRHSEYLPEGWQPGIHPSSNKPSRDDTKVKTILSEILEKSVDLYGQYPAIRAELLRLGEVISQTVCNPLLTPQIKRDEVKTAVRAMQELFVSRFYGRAQVSGYPFSADAQSKQALAYVNRIATVLFEAPPEATEIALAALGLGEVPSTVQQFASALERCRGVFSLLGLQTNRVLSATQQSSLAQCASLSDALRNQRPEGFEFRSLALQDCGLVVRQVSKLPRFVIESIRIGSNTDLADLVSLLKHFTDEQEIVIQRAVSAATSREHERVQDLGECYFSDTFRPPLVGRGAIISSDGRLVPENSVVGANFYATFLQQPGSALVQVLDFSCNRAGLQQLREEVSTCFRYNKQLIDGLLHGPHRQRLSLAPAAKRENYAIKLNDSACDPSAKAKWLETIADRVASGKVHESLALLLASAPGDKAAQRVLEGAELVSAIVSLCEALKASHGIVLGAIESCADRLSLECVLVDGGDIGELLAHREASSAEDVQDIVMHPGHQGLRDLAIAELAHLLASSPSIRPQVHEYALRLLFLEGKALRQRFDESVLHRLKAGLLRHKFGDLSNPEKLIGSLGSLESNQVLAACKASGLRREDVGAAAVRIATIQRAAERCGFYGFAIKTLSTQSLKDLVQDSIECVAVGAALDPLVDHHLITDSLTDDPSFVIKLLWNGEGRVLDPRILGIWAAPHCDVDKLGRAIQGIHRAIFEALKGGDFNVSEVTRRRISRQNVFSIKDSHDRHFRPLRSDEYALWIGNGTAHIETSSAAIPQVVMRGGSYAVRLVAPHGSPIIRVHSCVVTEPEGQEGEARSSALEAVRGIILSVLRHNAEVAQG